MKELPTWAGPDVIIAATMSKLDVIVAAASAQVGTCQHMQCALRSPWSKSAFEDLLCSQCMLNG